MELSILIVTKNRPDELEITLAKLFDLLNLSKHEVLVFIDGCEKTKLLIPKYPWVNWESSDKSKGASPARNALYKKAKGEILIGLDDDAHPLSHDFINQIQCIFAKEIKIAIIAFQEVKGIFRNDQEALLNSNTTEECYYTNDFVGCGFAIKNEVYQLTNGFPVWIDIYGEESCLAMEVLALGYEIYYDNKIIINHRIDKLKRLHQGRNYFRFEKQLKNTIFYYLVYYPNPFYKICKLLFHNFKKYGLSDKIYFRLFWKSIVLVIINFRKVLHYRNPVKVKTLQKIKSLKSLKY